MVAAIDAYNEEAWELRNTDLSKTIELTEKAHSLALKEDYKLGLAHCFLIQGYVDFRLSKFQDSLLKTTEAVKRFRSLEYKLGIQRSLNTLGVTYGQMGDFANALKAFLEVQKLAKQLKLKSNEADALTNLAIIYMNYGDYALALEYNLESLSIYQEIQAPQSEGKTLQNIGVIYFELTQYEEALQQFQKAEHLLKDDLSGQLNALVYANLGRTYHKLKQDDYAQSYQYKALALMQKLNDKSGMSYVMDEIGRRHLDKHEYDQAESFLEESLSLKKDLGDRKGELDSSLHLATLYQAQHKLDSARVLFQKALKISQELGTKAEEVKAHFGLASLFQLQENYKDAFLHLQQHGLLKDELSNDSSDQRFQGLRIKFEVEQTEHEKEIYRLKNVELAQLNEELQILTEKLEKQAVEDPLTKLYNRRHFEAVSQEAYKRSFRYGNPLSVMICDIDNFKKVNDTFSHAVGDEVLIRVATIFRDNLRESDTLARYGGEEFVALFPETPATEASVFCERFRELIESYPWHSIHPDLKVTISMGVCEDTSLGSSEGMISKADEALYEVKRNGKNHVRIWRENGSKVWAPYVTEGINN